jgi:hypothetical protein
VDNWVLFLSTIKTFATASETRNFFLLFRLILKGNKTDLKQEDLWQLTKDEKSGVLLEKVECIWSRLAREYKHFYKLIIT